MSYPSTKRPNVLANALARTVNQLKKQKRNRAGVLALDAPIPPDWWPGEPEFAGLVPKEDQEKDMEIRVNIWPNSAQQGETDVLTFQWKPSSSSNWQNAQAPQPIQGPLNPADFPMALQLDKVNFTQEGTFDLRYQVTIDAGTTTDSEITQFIIDKTPPNANQSAGAPTFVDPVIISEGVTNDYLVTNGGVNIFIPTYNDQQLGDSVQIFVHNPGSSPTQPNYSAEFDANREIQIPATAFAGLLDGVIYVAFRLVDKVGNLGPESLNATTGLFINPLPNAPLAAPTVPRIADDRILHLDDVALGEDLVEIELYDNWLEGDVLTLTWGLGGAPVAHTMTSADDPIVLNVSYRSVLAPAYGTATGVLPTSVSYTVKRGNKVFDSDVATIDVDFFVPGPVNPDRPDPVNTNLPRVTVRGTGVSPEDNVLNADDAGLPVEVTFDLYTPIGNGEELLLYWYALGDINKVGTLSPVTGTAGDPYTFTVIWDSIKDLPSGTQVPVFYTVGRVGSTDNVESCVPTLVDVSAALPIQLADPEFPDAGVAGDGSPILNCTSFIGPDQHVLVVIPPNDPLLAGGEVVDFTWQCFTDKFGQDASGTPQEFTKTLTVDEATNGFELELEPFDDYILPVGRNGSITLTYVSQTAPPMEGTMLIRAAAMDAAGVCEPNARRNARGRCGC
ncbi:hypothetical protein ABQX22_00135 [Xanthomonas sp. WHRI 1810A]|uniref:hypothetical protein n=1 Tax=Xanthomonas sp. WHRI 1810A TaxID=3161565 RepID=UPI0032E8EFA6